MEKLYWPKTPLPANAGQAGIYAIMNMVNGSVYVGSSVDIDFRFTSHGQHLRRGVANCNLLKDWKILGDDAFYFDVLECVSDVAILREREQFWLDQIRLLRPVYNIVLQVGNPFRDPNFVQHMKEVTKGRPKSPEHVAKVVKAITGQKRTPEQCERIGEGHKGQVPWNKGKKVFENEPERLAKFAPHNRPNKCLTTNEEFLEIGLGIIRQHGKLTSDLFNQECGRWNVVVRRWGDWSVFVAEVKSLLSEDEQPEPQRAYWFGKTMPQKTKSLMSWKGKLDWARRKGTLIEGETFLAL